MNTTETPAEQKYRLFEQGRDYWHEYEKLNGFAMWPSRDGLKKLSRQLDINIPWLRKCINIFLEA